MGWFNIIKVDLFWQFLTSLAGNAELAFGLEGTVHDVDEATQRRIHRLVELVTNELEETGPSEDLTELEALQQRRIIRLVNDNLAQPPPPEREGLYGEHAGGGINWLNHQRHEREQIAERLRNIPQEEQDEALRTLNEGQFMLEMEEAGIDDANPDFGWHGVIPQETVDNLVALYDAQLPINTPEDERRRLVEFFRERFEG